MAIGPIRLSVIVPVHNGGTALGDCLAALTTAPPPAVEFIVVDDASTDDSAAVAARRGVRVVGLTANVGPAGARNRGAREASGDILLFVDADVVVARGALERVMAVLGARPDVAALFGSYDANPAAPGVVSRYKNLLHHFVHQHGAQDASTFWAGCGAIRRAVFEDVGGFDEERFRAPSIEDIELGYRLRRRGHLILLDRELQGTHLKRWTLRSLVWTDVRSRAAPWARLLLEHRDRPHDLNVKRDQKVSAALVGLAVPCLVLAPAHPQLAAVATAALLGVVGFNWRLYRFFARQGGLLFATAGVLLHWLYYLYSGATFLVTWGCVRLRVLSRASPRPSRTP